MAEAREYVRSEMLLIKAQADGMRHIRGHRRIIANGAVVTYYTNFLTRSCREMPMAMVNHRMHAHVQQREHV